jgi:O-antigen/teichoic acid export membrane protein
VSDPLIDAEVEQQSKAPSIAVRAFKTITQFVSDPAAHALVFEFGFLSGSTFFCQAANLTASLYMARLLGPTHFGIWTALLVATSYGPSLTAGVLNAMSLLIPLRRGRSELDNIADVAAAGALSIGLVIVGGGLFGLAYGYFGASGITRTAVWLTIPYFAAYLCQVFIQAYLRAQKRFSLISWQLSAQGVGFLAIAIPLTRLWGLPGCIVGMTATVALSALIGASHIRLRVAFRHFAMLPSMSRLGIPIVAVGAVHVFLYTFDRWIVLWMLGTRDLGLYAFAVRIASVSLLVAGVLADQTYPRMAEAYGRTGSVSALRSYVNRQLALTAALLAPGVVLVGVAAVPFTRSLFPQYLGTLGVLRIYLLSYVVLALAGPFGCLLNVIQKQRVYLSIQGLVFLFQITLVTVFVKSGFGLSGVAMGCSIGYVAYVCALASISYGMLRSAARQDRCPDPA